MSHGHPVSRHDAERTLFSAVITPHRSLGRNSFRLVMTLVCVASIVSSIPFIVAGAWPVSVFFGLDVVALYIAFRVNFRDGTGREHVSVSALNVEVAKVLPTGQRAEWRFDTLWTKLERETDEDYGLMKLAVVSRGQSVPVAQALSPGERESFAEAFGRALATAKSG